jgi:hypothetical protein
MGALAGTLGICLPKQILRLGLRDWSVVQSAVSSWFDRKDKKDNPVFWYQRVPIWIGTQAILRTSLTGDDIPSLRFLGDLPNAGGKPVLLACCDEVYFYRFAYHLAISGHQASPGLSTHIHIYDPSSQCLEDAALLRRRLGDRLTFSHEPPGRSPYKMASPYFFTAGRFAVAQHILERNGGPVLVIDVDGIVRRDLQPEIAYLANWDVGLVLRASRRRQWRKVLACAVLLNPTPAGRLFSARFAVAIERVLRRAPPFHMDQIVLHYLCEHYRRHAAALRIADLGERWADHHFHPESLIWTAKGNARKLELAQMATPHTSRL